MWLYWYKIFDLHHTQRHIWPIRSTSCSAYLINPISVFEHQIRVAQIARHFPTFALKNPRQLRKRREMRVRLARRLSSHEKSCGARNALPEINATEGENEGVPYEILPGDNFQPFKITKEPLRFTSTSTKNTIILHIQGESAGLGPGLG